MQERWSALEADAAAAREAAEEAKAAAGKADADLAALSTAYNDLEAHAFKLEEQLKEQEEAAGRQEAQQPAAAAAPSTGLTEAELEARIQAAVEQVRFVGVLMQESRPGFRGFVESGLGVWSNGHVCTCKYGRVCKCSRQGWVCGPAAGGHVRYHWQAAFIASHSRHDSKTAGIWAQQSGRSLW